MALTNSRQRRIQRANVLRDVTIRDFSGGWNVVDNDLNLDSKYSKILDNIQRSVDGANAVRPGVELFVDISNLIPAIINMEYFSENLIVVASNGKIVRVDKHANAYILFNEEFASALPGAPNPWGTTTFVSFATFNGELVICNGLDKPLTVTSGMQVTYLQDKATGSNVNTPVCKYVKTVGRYLVMGGDPESPSTLYISGTDTTTFLGDSSTDAVNYDLASRVGKGSSYIKGLGGFRDKLVVGFEEVLIPVTLGTFSGNDHTPTFGDDLDEHGLVAHRAIQAVGDDMFFSDLTGVQTMKRATFTGATKVEEQSSLVNPDIQTQLDKVIDYDTGVVISEENVFSVYDSQSKIYMLFVPNDPVNVTETKVYAYRKVDALKIDQWQAYRGWNFVAACQSQLKRVFFADRKAKGVIWRRGEEHDLRKVGKQQHLVPRDYMGYEEMFTDNTEFSDGHGFGPVASFEDSGVSIKWTWELPWFDNDDRFSIKISKYINFDTFGRDAFTAMMFVDNIYEDRDNFGQLFSDDTSFSDLFGWDVETLDPLLSMGFVAGEGPGFGGSGYGRRYGDGRPTRLEQLYAWPARYKIGKLRFEGYSIDGLKFVSITMAYQGGSIRR